MHRQSVAVAAQLRNEYDSLVPLVDHIVTYAWTWCTDTSDPRHFGPKAVRHYVFGTEMSHFFCVGAEVSLGVTLWHCCRSVPKTLRHWCRTVSTFYEGAEVSNGHFGTSAELS